MDKNDERLASAAASKPSIAPPAGLASAAASKPSIAPPDKLQSAAEKKQQPQLPTPVVTPPAGTMWFVSPFSCSHLQWRRLRCPAVLLRRVLGGPKAWLTTWFALLSAKRLALTRRHRWARFDAESNCEGCRWRRSQAHPKIERPER